MNAITPTATTSPQFADLDAQRAYLEANTGIRGLEILSPGDAAHAPELFRRDGFVVIADVLDSAQVEFLARGCREVADEILALDTDRKGNRGSHRYSFGGSSLTRSQLHRPEWRMLLDNEIVNSVVTGIFQSPDFVLRAASGDFCMPGATGYQPLHSDLRDWKDGASTPYSAFHDPRGQLTIRDLPCPYVCANFLPQEVTRLNGPTRQIPGTQNARHPIPSLAEEPESMKSGSISTADGGPVTRAAAQRRLARMVLADPEQVTEDEAIAMAAWCADRQSLQVARALRRVAASCNWRPLSIVLSGHGGCLARRALARVGWDVDLVSLPDTLGPDVSRAAPAHSLALIARGQLA